MWLKTAAAFIVLLLLAPQPNSLPLIAAVRNGLAAQASGDMARAADALANAYARQPWNAAFAFDVGRAELAAGQYEAALRDLTTTARLGGWTPELRVLAGDAYNALGDRANALSQWETAARDLPGDVNLSRRLAEGYEAAGKFPEAVDALRVVAAAAPGEAEIQFRLGQLLAVVDPRAAVDPLEKAARIDSSFTPRTTPLVAAIQQAEPQGDEAYLSASVGLVFIQAGQYDLAEAAFSRAIRFNLTYPDAYAYLGLAQDKLGKDGGAALQEAVRLAPDSALAHSFLGLHYRRTGQANEALSELTRASELDPNNPALAAEIAGAHEALADFEKARQWYEAAIHLAPGDPRYKVLLAQFYVENEIDLAGAGFTAALNALKAAPDSAAAHDALGFDYVLRQDFASGEKHLLKAIELDPNLASAHYHLGVLRAAQNDMTAGESEYRRALELDPEGRYGNLALKALALLKSQ
ncbi:MAG: tetratricopeptide repeat protein [Chloroflexi bacterium]|nr:tetratricopeptide repeat protein [Chloroflexota bacterium]